MPRSVLDRLREELDARDYRILMEVTDGGRLLPFGPQAAEVEALLLAEADDSVIDILAQCERIIGEDADRPAPRPPALACERICFTFPDGGPEVDHFLASLQRNGFASTALESGEVHVFVYLECLSDLEFFRSKETLKSLYELSSVARGRMPKGRRME